VKEEFVRELRCPACRREGTLELHAEAGDEREVREGTLRCGACGHSFAVHRGARGSLRAATLEELQELLERPWMPEEVERERAPERSYDGRAPRHGERKPGGAPRGGGGGGKRGGGKRRGGGGPGRRRPR